LEEALRPIGWEKAKKFKDPLWVRIREHRLEHDGGRIGKDYRESKELLEQHRKALEALDYLQTFFSAMRLNMREAIAMTPSPSEELAVGKKRVEEYLAAQDGVRYGILDSEMALEIEVQQQAEGGRPKKRPGRPKNMRAYNVAEIVAEIYVVGMGKTPGVSGEDETGQYSTPYVRAVESVFRVLGLSANPIEPCDAAKNKLNARRIAQLLDPDTIC
jgi:hypothetical protein